jgi:hypothetical protein
MSLSAREQRILSKIEREIAAVEPLLDRALATMGLGLRDRAVAGRPALRDRGSRAGQGWAVGVLAGLLAGIAVLSAGLALGVLAMVIGGTALTQLSLIAGWLARALTSGQRPGR